jgi:hypothetical protein
MRKREGPFNGGEEEVRRGIRRGWKILRRFWNTSRTHSCLHPLPVLVNPQLFLPSLPVLIRPPPKFFLLCP